jgi:uncharacterized protein YkwD
LTNLAHGDFFAQSARFIVFVTFGTSYRPPGLIEHRASDALSGALSVFTVVLCVAVAAPEVSARPLTERGVASATRNTALIAAVNTVRTAHLLPQLQVDANLSRAARSHSRDMLVHDYFAHGNFAVRMSRFGVRGRVFAENLAWGSGVMSANATVARWLASPPHLTVLLDPSLRRIGVATPIGAFGGFARATLVTADFAG